MNIQNVVNRYLQSFNETNAERRRASLREVYAEDAAYTDPHVELRGLEQIDGFIAAVQAKYPGVVFSLGGTIDAHHDTARFTWHAGPPGAEPVAVGFDVAVFEQGRIRRIYGFLDKSP